MKAERVLFITSFLPVAAFKAIARLGDATWGQAQVAVVVGLFLGVVQYVAARKILKVNTYLEKAFLGFLLVGTIWVHLFPAPLARLFVDHSVALLYATLFLMTLFPQLLGYDPFTYAIAKQWAPESVWRTPEFRTINLRITYLWSAVFFASFLSSFLGKGRPLYAIGIPFALCIGIGVVFSRKYPEFYVNRKYGGRLRPSGPLPDSVALLIEGMPRVFNPEAAAGLEAEIQFDISGEGGGKWVLSIAGGKCGVRKGEADSPILTIAAPGEIWLKMARGEINRPKALMDGLIKVNGDMQLLIRMAELFKRPPA